MLNNYIMINNLMDPTNDQFIISDDLFLKVFSQEIPSLYQYIEGKYILTQKALNKLSISN